jgi:hypothetical protein
MDLHIFLAALVPPGNITAAAEAFQDSLFALEGGLSLQGLTPVIPLRFFREAIDPPGELRLEAPLEITGTVEYRSNLYLPLSDPGPLDDLLTALPEQEDVSTASPFPVYPGIFLGRSFGLPADMPPFGRFQSSSFSLALIEYRLKLPADGWWEQIEELRHWERRIRKPRPLAARRKKG